MKTASGTIRFALHVVVLLVMMLLPAWGIAATAQETIGIVRNSGGAATVTRGDQVLAAAPGTKLLVGDTLATGPDGSLGVIFRDNSTLSLGPGSSIVLQSFLFSPSEGTLMCLYAMDAPAI